MSVICNAVNNSTTLTGEVSNSSEANAMNIIVIIIVLIKKARRLCSPAQKAAFFAIFIFLVIRQVNLIDG